MLSAHFREARASLRDNPLFIREWKRVMGRPGLLFRVVLCLGILYGISLLAPYFYDLLPNPPLGGLKRWIRILEAAIGSAFLDPMNLLVTWLAWRSIDVEHRRGMAQSIALTPLGGRELFWAKALPTMCFSLLCLYPFVILYSLWEVLSYTPMDFQGVTKWGVYANLVIDTFFDPILCLLDAMVCYLLMIKWPSLRRNGLVILPTLLIYGTANAVMIFLPSMIVSGRLSSLVFPVWNYVLNPILHFSVFLGTTYFLMLMIAPRGRHLFMDESPRFVFGRIMRAQVRVRRAWRAARTA